MELANRIELGTSRESLGRGWEAAGVRGSQTGHPGPQKFSSCRVLGSTVEWGSYLPQPTETLRILSCAPQVSSKSGLEVGGLDHDGNT